MPQDQGRTGGIDGPADDLQISAAQAHRADADHHVVRGYLWRFGNLSDLELLTKRVQDHGFHTMILPPPTSRMMPVTQLAARPASACVSLYIVEDDVHDSGCVCDEEGIVR